jgi:hypothetical protein
MNTSLKLLTLIIFPWKRLGSVHLNPNFSSTTQPITIIAQGCSAMQLIMQEHNG